MTSKLYIHKKTGERMKVVRLTDGVATCERVDRPKVWYSSLGIEKYPAAICLIQNLSEVIEERV